MLVLRLPKYTQPGTDGDLWIPPLTTLRHSVLLAAGLPGLPVASCKCFFHRAGPVGPVALMPANPKLTGPLCWLTGTLWSPLWPPLRYCDFWGWLKPLTLFPVFGYSPKPKGYSFRLKVNLKVHCPKSPSPAGPLPAAPSPQPWGEAESRAQCLLPHGWEELGQGCLGCWVSSILPFLLCVYGD